MPLSKYRIAFNKLDHQCTYEWSIWKKLSLITLSPTGLPLFYLIYKYHMMLKEVEKQDEALLAQAKAKVYKCGMHTSPMASEQKDINKEDGEQKDTPNSHDNNIVRDSTYGWQDESLPLHFQENSPSTSMEYVQV